MRNTDINKIHQILRKSGSSVCPKIREVNLGVGPVEVKLGSGKLLLPKMEFPPTEWEVFPEGDFELAVPRDPGKLGAEIMTQARGNGKIQDHLRVVLGGSDLVERIIPVSMMINKSTVPAWKVRISTWPRDINIRRNMATSAWMDIRDLVAAGEMVVEDADGSEVDNEAFVDFLDQGSSTGTKEKASTALRWAVTVGEDHHLRLDLQSLPVPLANINGKPLLKG